LCIAGQRAADLAAAHGTPLFVYDSQAVRARVAALRAALPARVALHYAVKANPFGPLVALMAGLVDGFDIASGGELALLQAQGIDPARAGFAGPGKRDADLSAAIAAGVTLHCESAREVERALALAQGLDRRPRLAIRVNPDFDLRGSGMKMGGARGPLAWTRNGLRRWRARLPNPARNGAVFISLPGARRSMRRRSMPRRPPRSIWPCVWRARPG
jgi:diaminopimelate decarboxylase